MSDNNSIDRVNLQIERDRFRQTRILFCSATIVTALSASIALLGIGEIISGNSHGTETMLVGLNASVNSIRLMRSASDRSKQMSDKYND